MRYLDSSKECFSVSLIDFGLSLDIDANDKKKNSLTSNQITGQIQYLAPEIIDTNTKDLNHQKIDAWAFGVVLYKILTGSDKFVEPLNLNENPEYSHVFAKDFKE